jgi:hypothetical protein
MKEGMSGTCSTYRREERSIKIFGGKKKKKEATWKTCE